MGPPMPLGSMLILQNENCLVQLFDIILKIQAIQLVGLFISNSLNDSLEKTDTTRNRRRTKSIAVGSIQFADLLQWVSVARPQFFPSHLIPKGTLITSTRMALGKAVVYEVDV